MKQGVWVQFYYLILIKATIYYEKVAIMGILYDNAPAKYKKQKNGLKCKKKLIKLQYCRGLEYMEINRSNWLMVSGSLNNKFKFSAWFDVGR